MLRGAPVHKLTYKTDKKYLPEDGVYPDFSMLDYILANWIDRTDTIAPTAPPSSQ
jgi:hypothetical protein